MKITFICVVFPPEPAPSGLMAHQLATRLARDGHDVTMIVPFPNRPEGITYPGFRRRLRSRTVTVEGYTLIRCANWLIGKRRRMLNRILENVTFGISSTWAAWRDGRPDVVLIESWPLFATQFAAAISRLWRAPYFYYVKDVYPETAEVTGLLNREGSLAKTFRAWDRHLCMGSSRVIVISETMRDLMVRNRKLPRDRFVVVRDWIDESIFTVCPRDNPWRRSQHIERDTFLAMFAGTLGHISGADVLVKAAKILEKERALLLCIGEGVLKQTIREEAVRLGLSNIRLLPFEPSGRVPEVQASADAMLLTMRPNHSDASVPSKLISYLAASRPVICAANADSAISQTVLAAQAGIVVDPGDAEAIARAILRLMRAPEEAQEMGRNARRYFEEHYTLGRACREFSDLFYQAVNPEVRPIPCPMNEEFSNDHHESN
jgi:colanic acid biosynthesis glycosyl transferase WcaI